jgi:hypothetical protein
MKEQNSTEQMTQKKKSLKQKMIQQVIRTNDAKEKVTRTKYERAKVT